MNHSLSSFRALAGILATLLVAGMLSLLTGTTAQADEAGTATVSGSLINPDGTPVENAYVDVYPAGSAPGTPYAYVNSVHGGSFTLTVAPGSWRVVVRPSDETYLDHTYEDVTVGEGDELTLPPAELQESSRTSVSGAVTVQGVPRAGLEVSLIRIGVYGDWLSVSSATTDNNGEYTLPGVRDDRTYTVQVQGAGISSVLLGGSADPASAETFTRADGSPLPTIDVEPSAKISGRLLGDGSPLKGDVNIYKVTPTGPYQHQTYDYTDANGNWSLEVPAGDYVIYAHAYDPRYLFTYVGSRASDNMFGPGSFRVEAGEVLTKDIDVLPASMVNGTVLANGAPAAGAYVMAFAWDETKKSWAFVSDDHAAEDGTYSLPTRDGQLVTVRFSETGFRTQYLGGSDDFPEAPTAANSVTAKGRNTSLPPFALAPLVTPSPSPSPTPTPAPAPAKKVKATIKVKGPKSVKAGQRAKLTVRVRTTGKKPRPVAKGYVEVKMTAKGKVKGTKVRTLRVKLTKNGRATIKLPKLAKGKWVIRVTYKGNATTKKATSKRYVLKVTAKKKAKKARKR